MTEEKVRVAGRTVPLGNPDKVLFDDAGITKRDLAEYYQAVAPAMLPHLRGRPLSVERFPDGIDGGGFMQKQVPPSVPSWVHRTEVDRVGGGSLSMYVGDNAATLVYLANQAALTLHPWLSRVRSPHRPDRLVFDLDPADDDFATVRMAAKSLREILDDLGLESFPMTTGSRGMHVTVPIDGRMEFEDVRACAGEIADELVARHPKALTTEVRKSERKGRLFVDTLRNSYGQHAVAPYSVRPLPGAPVATPLDWDEVDDAKLTARTFTIATMARRLASTKGDPWKSISRRSRSLRSAQRELATAG